MNAQRLFVIFLGMGLLACESSPEPTDPIEPPPHEGEDRVTFWVHAPPADAVAGTDLVLRWKGNGAGPDPDSPEQTDVPWVGYAQPFRVEWEADFDDAPVRGYKVRVSQRTTGPFLPRDASDNSVFGDLTSFFFENGVAAEVLEGEDCPAGPDCPEKVRFDSGPYRIEMLAENTNGLLSDRDLGLLGFEINYPPETSFPVDPPACDDTSVFPHYVYQPARGAPIVCSVASGQTIPAGAEMHFRLDGFDRLDPEVAGTEVCCDLRLNLAVPEVRFQTRLELATEDDQGVPFLQLTVFSQPQEDGVFVFPVGPFAYTVAARSVDEHLRRDPSDSEFTFVGGFEPTVVAVSPGEGQRLWLRDPSPGTPWPENDIPYDVGPETVRHWDPVFQRYLNASTENTITIDGRWFSFSLEFTAASHPDEPPPGGVVAWAYELIGEFDPGNSVANGGGFDRLDQYSSVPELNHWKLTGDDRVAIFVPSLFWSDFEFIDPDGNCVEDLCAIGEFLRRHLGQHTLQVRGRTTRASEIFEQRLPEVVEGSQRAEELAVGRLGRRTPIVTRTFDIRIGRADGSGQFIGTWPE